MRGYRNLVLWKGLEPSWDKSHKYLKLACLPIPPPEHNTSFNILLDCRQAFYIILYASNNKIIPTIIRYITNGKNVLV